MTTLEVRPAELPEITLLEEVAEPPRRTAPSQVAIAGGIAALTVAVAPGWSTSAWAPKEAVLVVLAAAGLPVLVATAFARSTGPMRRGAVTPHARLCARLGCAFVAVALVSALVSRSPALAMVGLYQQGTGWVFVAGAAGCWALGTRLDSGGRDLLGRLLVYGGMVNAVVAVLQLVVNLGSLGLPLYDGNLPDGLQSNPFELGALMAAGLALTVDRYRRSPREWYLPVVVLMVGAGASGMRLPLVLVVCVLAVACWQAFGPGRHETREVARRTVGFCALSICGVLAGTVFASVVDHFGTFQRVAGATSEETFGQRLMAWKIGVRSVASHPLLGAGPGQYRAATSALFPLSFVRNAPDEVFTDAHNFVVEYVTTTGVLGLAALLGFLAVVLYRARGPLVLAALVLLGIELAEPLDVAIFPVALAALGAAVPLVASRATPVCPPPLGRLWRRAVAVFAVVGIAAGGLFLAADGVMLRADGQFDLAQDQSALSSASFADAVLSAWPDPAVLLGRIHFYMGLGGHTAERDEAVHWAQVAVSRDPTDPAQLLTLADYELDAGRFRAALESAREARTYLPWYPSALNVLGVASLALGEKATAHHWFGLSLEIEPHQPPIEAFYKGSCTIERNDIGLSLLSRSCTGP